MRLTLWGAAALWRVLAVPHLHAREADARAVLRKQLHQRRVPVPLPRVIVPGCQLRGVRARLVPPVHACQLRAQVARRLELVHHVTIALRSRRQDISC